MSSYLQACNIREARHLYDQLAPITPIILALSAAAPVYRGFLSDVDCRFFEANKLAIYHYAW